MGQYHYVANLDKREFIHPHAFGDGLKLLEFGPSGDGTMLGLALLLAASNNDRDGSGAFSGNRGGGDFHVWADPYGDGRDVGDVTKEDHDLARAIVGRWAGDRIAIIGDYAESGDIPGEWDAQNSSDNPWQPDPEEDPEGKNSKWTDISPSVYRVMELDYYTRETLKKRAADSQWYADSVSRRRADMLIVLPTASQD